MNGSIDYDPYNIRWRDVGNLPNKRNLPRRPAFNPDDRNASQALPPKYILDQAPSSQEWKKRASHSTEFNQKKPTQNVSERNLHPWTTQNNWKGRFPAVFDRENMSYDGKSMVLKVRKHDTPTDVWKSAFKRNMRDEKEIEARKRDGRGFYSGCFVKSKKTIQYGYFETVVKLGDSTLSSAFWLKEQRGRRRREIDVFEYSTSDARLVNRRFPFQNGFLMNVHEFTKNQAKSESRPKSVDIGTDLSKEPFVKVGLLWTKEKICWYLNDTLMRELDHAGVFSRVSMNVQFDREYLGWFGEPDEKDKYGDFKVMYIRTWQLEDKVPRSRMRRARDAMTRSFEVFSNMF